MSVGGAESAEARRAKANRRRQVMRGPELPREPSPGLPDDGFRSAKAAKGGRPGPHFLHTGFPSMIVAVPALRAGSRSSAGIHLSKCPPLASFQVVWGRGSKTPWGEIIRCQWPAG